MNPLTAFAIRHPRRLIALATLVTAVFGWQFRAITIDTDPENMLEASQPDRVVYDAVKKTSGSTT